MIGRCAGCRFWKGVTRVEKDDYAQRMAMGCAQLGRNLKVALVSSFPPVPCGVADYADHLQSHLKARGHSVEIISGNVWDIARGVAIHRALKALAPDVVHFQYPSLGFGAGLAPQVAALLARALPTVVTLHEFSQVHILRKMAILPFTLAAGYLIFTSEYERLFLSRFAPWIRKRSSVVGIGSNVPEPKGKIIRREKTIGYFGAIRPDKGLEQYFKLAELMLKYDPAWSFSVIGHVQAKERVYVEGLMRVSAALPNVVWLTDMDLPAVAISLAGIRYAYLAFPDGASERRGSLLGAMTCGTLVITTRGPQTPRDMLGAVLFAETPAMALGEIVRLEEDSSMRNTIKERARQYAEERSWLQIAAEHESIYRRVMEGNVQD